MSRLPRLKIFLSVMTLFLAVCACATSGGRFKLKVIVLSGAAYASYAKLDKLDTPVTLEFQDTDLWSVCDALRKYIDISVLAHSWDASLRITGRFENAPIRDVFTFLKETYGVSIVSSDRHRFFARTDGVPQKCSGDGETRFFHFTYADPDLIKEFLVETMDLTPEKVLVDYQLRRIYVTSTPRILDEIAQVMREYDRWGQRFRFHVRFFEYTKAVSADVQQALVRAHEQWRYSHHLIGGYGNTKTIEEESEYLQAVLAETFRELDATLESISQNGHAEILLNCTITTLDKIETAVVLNRNENEISLLLMPKLERDGSISIRTRIAVGSNMLEPKNVHPYRAGFHVHVRNEESFIIGNPYEEDGTGPEVINRMEAVSFSPTLKEILGHVRSSNPNRTPVLFIIPERACESWSPATAEDAK